MSQIFLARNAQSEATEGDRSLSETKKHCQGALVPVHGGLPKLVENTIPLSQRRQFLADAAGLPTVVVTKADLSAALKSEN